MITHDFGVEVKAIAVGVPQVAFGNDVFKFPEQERKAVEDVQGVLQRRFASDGQTIATLAVPAAERVLNALKWGVGVDALIVVTQTPIKPAPPSAAVIAARLGLADSVAAFDVNLGCSGYVYGLKIAASLVAGGGRALLVAGDVCSSYLDWNDRATAMLFGDAVSVTAIGSGGVDVGAQVARFVLGTDGSGAEALKIEDDCGRLALRMRGPEVFAFTLSHVPQLFDAVGGGLEPLDAVLLHQANAQMVKTLARKLGTAAKTPCNVAHWGNTSSASIPLLACDVLGERLKAERLNVAMLGFGIGWSWAGVRMRMGPLACADIVGVREDAR